MRDFYAVQLRISYDYVIVFGKNKEPCCCSVLFGLVPGCPCNEKDFAGFLAVNYFCESLSMYHHVQSIQLISASTYISLNSSNSVSLNLKAL